jgi:hypothetical protein
MRERIIGMRRAGTSAGYAFSACDSLITVIPPEGSNLSRPAVRRAQKRRIFKTNTGRGRFLSSVGMTVIKES